MIDDGVDLFIRHEGTMQAGNAPAASHMQHITLTQQLFRALFAEDGAAVDLGGDLEGNPGREVGLDGTGDNIDGRSLCRHDQVNTGSTGHLGKPLNGSFHILARDQHQVGHFVNDNDDIGQRLQIHRLFFEDRLTGILIETGLNRAFQFFIIFTRLGETFVEAGNVTHTELTHGAIAVFHFAHRPFQGNNRL